VKNVRWFICCQVAYATAVAAFWALIRTIAVLRWGTEETNAVFNLPRGTIAVPTESGVVSFKPLQFALLGFGIAAFFGAIAIVSWILRQSHRTKKQPTMMLAKTYASRNAVPNNEKSGRRSPSHPMKKVGLILLCLLPCFLYGDDPFSVFSIPYGEPFTIYPLTTQGGKRAQSGSSVGIHQNPCALYNAEQSRLANFRVLLDIARHELAFRDDL
jgi:hypothetical protein